MFAFWCQHCPGAVCQGHSGPGRWEGEVSITVGMNFRIPDCRERAERS